MVWNTRYRGRKDKSKMARKNIFELVEENYDIQSEIRKIEKLFSTGRYFGGGYTSYSFETIIKNYLFSDWKYRGTCISIEEYFYRANAELPNEKKVTEEVIINNLEVMENFVKLYFDNCKRLLSEYGIKYYTKFDSIFCNLVNTLEKKMGLTKREYKDRVIVYPF